MSTKTISKTIFIAFALLAGTLHAYAEENKKSSIFGIANRIGIGVGVGTEGIGIDIATPLSRYVHASFGVDDLDKVVGQDPDDDISKILDYVKVYPVIKLSIRGRIL